MKRIFIYLFIFLNTTFIFSQNEYLKSVDSLLSLLNNETNNAKKIAHYVALCNIYKTHDIIKLRVFNKRLLQALQNTNKTREFHFYYSNVAYLNCKDGNYDQAIIYSKKASDLSLKNGDWDNYILNTTNYALNLSVNHEIDKAIVVLNKIDSVALTKKSKYRASVYYVFAYVNSGISDYPRAIKYANKALSIEQNKINKGKLYHLISHIYSSLKNYKSAIEFNKLSLQIHNDNIIYKYQEAIILYDMGRYKKALNLLLNFKNPEYIDFNNNNLYYISTCYYRLKEYELANKYIDKRLKIGFARRGIEIPSKVLKAKIATALNQTQIAKKYINQSLDLLKDDDYFELKIEVFKVKQELEERSGNYKSALLYNKKITAIDEANNKYYKKNKLQQLQVELDVKEKNNRIINLQIAQVKKQIELKNEKDSIKFMFLEIFFLSLITLYFIFNQIMIRKKNRAISAVNSKLQVEKNITQKSLLEKETLLKEIHHRVKNNMQLVISLLKIQARDSKELSIENFIEVSENRIRSMALIHEYLYESENINYVNFEEYINRLSSSIRSSFSNQSNIKLETEIKNTHFNIETAIPLGLIINELVINAFKHAFAGKDQGVIKIILFKDEDLHHLIITDNGIGIDTIQENGSSIGLKIVKLLVSQINGQMQIKNDSGTRFSIQFKDINSINEQ